MDSGVVSVQGNGSFIGRQCLFVATEVFEGITLVEVCNGIVGVQVHSLLAGCQGFLIPAKAIKRSFFIQPLF